jgi:asparagine synthase (glutamine-hydrolysing)
MCGILAVHGLEKPSNERAHFIALSKRLRHRGPDWSGCYVGKQSILVHERLAIVGVGGCLCHLSGLNQIDLDSNC